MIQKDKERKPQIVISKRNYEILRSFGYMGSTFDECLTKVLENQKDVREKQ